MRHPALEPKQRVEFVEENNPDSEARWTLLHGERQEDPGLRVHTPHVSGFPGLQTHPIRWSFDVASFHSFGWLSG